MRPGVKGALLLLLAFAFGALAGALGSGILGSRWGWQAFRPGPRGQQVMLRHLDRELRLTPAQRERVEAILHETRQEFGRLREEMGPRFREIRLRSRARIREVLDPGQRERFEGLAARWEQRLQRRRDGPRP